MDMNGKSSRRRFLELFGTSSGALLLTNLGCGSSQANGTGDAGPTDADSGLSDTGSPSCALTGSDVRGPFHISGAPQRTRLAGDDEPGEAMVIEGTVFGPDCQTPVAGALLDVWQADAEGSYHEAGQDYRLRGQMMTDEQGKYRFETIRPGHYPLGGSMRPAHIHFTITRPGFRPLTTQLYFKGDPHLAPNDPCRTSCNSGDPTLIIELQEVSGEGVQWAGVFDIVLQRG
jgi:catechol 1,2-dioxygenase